jgi:FkbM family methyltransferase
VGVDVVPYRHTRHPIARRLRLMSQHGIELVLDVGANGGQCGRFLRNIGYAGRILSFEPLSTAFAALQKEIEGDPSWEARRAAVGDRRGTAVLNVAGNSESSSFLPMLPAHLAAFPESRYVAQEEVPMTTLADIISELPKGPGLFLKIDTQGYERQVLEGAGAALSEIRGVQIEMSITALYEGEMIMPAAMTFLAERGFVLMSLEPGASDQKTGQLLQVDGLFFRP